MIAVSLVGSQAEVMAPNCSSGLVLWPLFFDIYNLQSDLDSGLYHPRASNHPRLGLTADGLLSLKPLAEAALEFANARIYHRGIQAENACSCALASFIYARLALASGTISRRRPDLLGFLFGCAGCSSGALYIAAFHAFLTIVAT
jgi:hypothetical protein